MPTLHPLLERQLARSGITDASMPPTAEVWAEFLERISQNYANADQERYLLERSLSVSSKEMQDEIAERKRAEEALQQAHKTLVLQNQRLERIKELCRTMVEQMALTVKRGATTEELLDNLSIIQFEFERFDQQSKTDS
jgi:Fanconi anemia group F protein (FANCF)